MPVSPASVTQISAVIEVSSLNYEGIWLGTLYVWELERKSE